MTISVNGNDVAEIVQIAATIGSIVATLIVGFIIYLMVRPSRHDREARKARRAQSRPDPRESEDMWRLMDRVETRLAVLERALADRIERPRPAADDENRLFAPADHGRDSGRKE